MIEFRLDPTSGVATYLQLVHQVHQALQLGLLEPGDQLPRATPAFSATRAVVKRCAPSRAKT